MTPVKFPEVNCVLAKDQPEYTPLPVFYNSESPQKEMTACFELTDEEVAEIVRTRKIWHTQLTFGNPFQPVWLTTSSPFENVDRSPHPDSEKLPEMRDLDSSTFHRIHELVGKASMCWENPGGAGAFRDGEAADVAAELCALFKSALSK